MAQDAMVTHDGVGHTGLERAKALLYKAEAVLADLDGTLIFGDQPAPGARELVRHFGERLAVVSNYSTTTAEEMSERLSGIGLPIAPSRIVLAGDVAVRQLAAGRPGARLLCLMAPSMRALAASLGLVLVDRDPDVILVGRDLDLNYGRLAAAMQAVDAGTPLYATNLDRSHPGIDRRPVPETGSLIAAITVAHPNAALHVVGKPEPRLFQAALEILGVAPHQAVMLGDRPDTDVVGAKSLGIEAILIGAAPGADIANLSDIIAAQW